MTIVSEPAAIRDVLTHARTVAVVGLSADKLRASYFVGYYLHRNGYTVIPVDADAAAVLGQRSYRSLGEVPVHVDVVDAFCAPEAAERLAAEAVAMGAGTLWLQPGSARDVDPEFAARWGVDVVVDRCMRVEHARALGRLHWLGFNTGSVSSRRAHG